jgi:NADP-dependent 3-hydroxy acid dehydrogenase YdfG
MNEINQDTTQAAAVFKSIAVFGVGPGLGQAVARRYAREGYTVILVARRPGTLWPNIAGTDWPITPGTLSHG